MYGAESPKIFPLFPLLTPLQVVTTFIESTTTQTFFHTQTNPDFYIRATGVGVNALAASPIASPNDPQASGISFDGTATQLRAAAFHLDPDCSLRFANILKMRGLWTTIFSHSAQSAATRASRTALQ